MSLPTTTTTIPPRATSINKQLNSSTHDLKKSKRSKEENFELEDNDNWPEEIGLGNIIGDLDADIDRQNIMSASSSPMQSSSSSSSNPVSGKSTSTKMSNNVTSINTGSGAAGGSATATITETQHHSSGSNSSTSSNKEKDKGLKMKIKRTKTGCRNEPDGKLEIVQQLSSSTSGSDASSGSG